MAKYPTPIYFGQTSGYELHIYRGHTRYGTSPPELRKLWADALNLMHVLHLVLTPHWATKCLDDDIQVYFIDGNTCTSVYLNRGEFFQQHAPTVNPLFSIEETRFIWLVCRLLSYYGETKLTRVVDLILQLPLPDEDLIASLLCRNGLDTEFTPLKTPYDSNKTTYHLAHHLKNKQDEFYYKYSDTDMVPPPYIPRSLFQITHVKWLCSLTFCSQIHFFVLICLNFWKNPSIHFECLVFPSPLII